MWRFVVGLSVFLALWSVSSEGSCDSFSERLYPLFNLFDIQFDDIRSGHRLNLWQSRREKLVTFLFRGEDLYRKYLRGVRVASLSNRNMRLGISLPVTRGRTRHGLKLQMSRGALHYDGRSRGLGWRGALGVTGYSPRLEYVLDTGRHQLGVSASWSRFNGQDQLFAIQKFPHSETDREMNQLFLDLLGPTFGREITYGLRDEMWDLETGWLWALSGRNRLGMTVHLQRQKTGAEIWYLNTGPKAQFQGRRRTDLLLKVGSRRYVLTYEHRIRQRWRLRGEVGYTVEGLRLRLTPQDVPLSSVGIPLDLAELANGRGNRQGIDLKARGTWSRLDHFHMTMFLGWGRSVYKGQGKGTTPVLGFQLGVLPVAHKGEVDLPGTMASYVGGAQAHKRWGRVRLNAGAMLAQAGVKVQTRADAQLEFGLYVHPVRDVSRYRMTLLQLYATPSVQVSDKIRVAYQITQHAGKKRKVEEVEPIREGKVRGGMVHTLMLEYLF